MGNISVFSFDLKNIAFHYSTKKIFFNRKRAVSRKDTKKGEKIGARLAKSVHLCYNGNISKKGEDV
jgi:hypothetical protein